jgi:hypothetical protein
MNETKTVKDSYAATMAVRFVFPKPRNKYLRLMFLVAETALLIFIGELAFGYVWDYGFHWASLTPDQILARIGHAIAEGVWLGFWMGFPMWLALENFNKRNTESHRQR